MKLSLRGEYALRALVVLGSRYGPDLVPIQVISQDQKIPRRFLAQIMNDLRAARVVQSRRGVRGGYRLAKPPEQIVLALVIRHIEGALAPVSCVSEQFYRRCSCPDEATCAVRSIMKEVRDAIVKILEKATVADLCQRARQLEADTAKPIDYII